MIIRQNCTYYRLLHQKGKEKREKRRGDLKKLDFSKPRERERVQLLSKFLGDPTVEILRSKKESHFMRRGLRVGSGFKEFR